MNGQISFSRRPSEPQNGSGYRAKQSANTYGGVGMSVGLRFNEVIKGTLDPEGMGVTGRKLQEMKAISPCY